MRTLISALAPWMTLLCCLAAALLAEQLLAALVRAALQRLNPLVDDPSEALVYQRSLFTTASAAVRRLWLGILNAGLCAWLGWATQRPLFSVLGALILLATVAWDVWIWEVVVVSPWQVSWRRGLTRSVRRLPMADVAQVHVVTRPLSRRHGWLHRHFGQRLGTCYIALELHNGRALKLPRTGWLTGAGRLHNVARVVRKNKRSAERARILAIREQLRERPAGDGSAADPEALALREELSQLRRTRADDEHAAAKRLYALVRAERQVRLRNPEFDDTVLTAPFEISALSTAGR